MRIIIEAAIRVLPEIIRLLNGSAALPPPDLPPSDWNQPVQIEDSGDDAVCR